MTTGSSIEPVVIAGLAGPISFASYWLDFPLPRVVITLLLGATVFMIGYGVARYSALIEGRVIGRDFLYNGLVILLIATVYLFVVWSSVEIYGVPVVALAIVVILAILSHSLVDVGRRLFDFLFYNRETRELRAQLRHLAQRREVCTVGQRVVLPARVRQHELPDAEARIP